MRSWKRRVLGVVLVLFALIAITVMLLAFPNPAPSPIQYGVTFSAPHAAGIGLDWKAAYLAALDELQVKRLRLSAYWNTIEPRDNTFTFGNLDYQMDQAAARDATIILSIGRKLPRWPECHTPSWAEELPEEQQQEQVLAMLEEVVTRYRDHPALAMWQLENEPLLDFGICPPEDLDFLRREEALVRKLDGAHPIMITDSGELNSWLPAAQFGDIIGTTMYRTVFSSRTEKPFHYDYLFPSWVYRIKSRYVKLFTGKDVLISELQGEPWGAVPFTELSREAKEDSFSPERFYDLADFSRRTQLPTAYWWGVEYWYWEKVTKDNDTFWEAAKEIFGQESVSVE
jgi:hypothetical protein